MQLRDIHKSLIGKPQSRAALNTPALVLELDALKANIQSMADYAKRKGVSLRPHAKTHKSVDIAKMQIEAGALGVCCAKLGEAEALAEGGISNMLITSPVVTPQAIERLVKLNQQIEGLKLVVDHPDNVRMLAEALAGKSRLELIVDLDPGICRTGVKSPEAAVELATLIAQHAELTYKGVQFYCGGQQHIEDYLERKVAIGERDQYLKSVIDQLSDAGFAPQIVSGAGTGTFAFEVESGLYTELQVGSYVFLDQQYLDCEFAKEEFPFKTSLFVDASVVTSNTPTFATIDAGFKAFAADGGAPKVVSGANAQEYIFMGDEHGGLMGLPVEAQLPIGSRVTLAVSHCDPTVNLYDDYYVVQDDVLVDIWPVSARGRSS